MVSGEAEGIPSHIAEVIPIPVTDDRGQPRPPEELLPLVYAALRRLAASKLAQERPGQTLQATALVHEAWLRWRTTTRARPNW